MRMGLRYGMSVIMIALGIYILYSEYALRQRIEGLVLGSMLILWGFVRALMWKQIEKRYKAN